MIFDRGNGLYEIECDVTGCTRKFSGSFPMDEDATKTWSIEVAPRVFRDICPFHNRFGGSGLRFKNGMEPADSRRELTVQEKYVRAQVLVVKLLMDGLLPQDVAEIGMAVSASTAFTAMDNLDVPDADRLPRFLELAKTFFEAGVKPPTVGGQVSDDDDDDTECPDPMTRH